jgi:DHA2 family multidrug resistance protein
MSASTPAAPAAEPWKPSVSPWLVAISVMLATILEVLDTSVANVALPHMAGNLSASNEEATWVLTSYLVSNAIVLPLTGWLSVTFGRKRFLMTCVGLFVAASALCGAAPTLAALVMARVLQGAAGGALQPLSQSIMLESFPPEKRGVAMAVFGMGVVVAPIIGPTLGGWITDNYSWRWIFYINLPIGALALMLCQRFIEDPPYLAAAKARNQGRVDYIGFGLMALGLAALQIILDRGQQVDWFSAVWLRWFFAACVVCLGAFCVWELRAKHPIVNLRILKDNNFAMGTAMITAVGIVLYSTVALLPLFLQDVLGYPALDSGMALSPRGFGAVMAMVLVSRLIGRIDSRALIATGFCILSYSAWMFSGLNLDIGMSDVVGPNVIMGLAMGLIFVPLSTTAMAHLPVEQMGNAAGIYNLMRNIGGSIGISLVTTMLARGTQAHQALLVAHTSAFDPVFVERHQALADSLAQHTNAAEASQQAYLTLYHSLLQQAAVLTYDDIFRSLAVLCLVCVFGVAFFRRPRRAMNRKKAAGGASAPDNNTSSAPAQEAHG